MFITDARFLFISRNINHRDERLLTRSSSDYLCRKAYQADIDRMANPERQSSLAGGPFVWTNKRNTGAARRRRSGVWFGHGHLRDWLPGPSV